MTTSWHGIMTSINVSGETEPGRDVHSFFQSNFQLKSKDLFFMANLGMCQNTTRNRNRQEVIENSICEEDTQT